MLEERGTDKKRFEKKRKEKIFNFSKNIIKNNNIYIII